MATREDIEQPLTLEFGGEVEPAEFERLVAAFFDVIQGVEMPGDTLHWTVQVKKGSQLVGVRPVEGPGAAVVFARAIADGFVALESRAEKPRGFSDKALRGLRTIAKASDSACAPRIWADFVARPLSLHVAANINELLEGNLVEYGAVTGKLETLSERNGFRFVVYDEIWDHAVNCLFEEEVMARVMNAFGKRVEVYGEVRYRKDGRATAVTVEDFVQFPDADKLPTAAAVRGILRNYRRD
jgi:hypothetical protein